MRYENSVHKKGLVISNSFFQFHLVAVTLQLTMTLKRQTIQRLCAEPLETVKFHKLVPTTQRM